MFPLDGKKPVPVLDLSGLSAEEAATAIASAAIAAVGEPIDRTPRRINAALAAVNGISTEALEEAAGFADPWHRLGCLRDICEIERAFVSKEPRR